MNQLLSVVYHVGKTWENHGKTAQSRVYSFIIFFPFQIAMDQGSNGSSFRHAPGDIGPYMRTKEDGNRQRHVSNC